MVTTYCSFVTTVSQLRICDFSGETFKGFFKCYIFLCVQRRQNCSPAASFANCVMTLYVLKVHLQTFLSTPVTQRWKILTCDILVGNERFMLYTRVGTLIVATIYLQLIQNRYMFRNFTVLQCSHQHCVQPVASDVEVVGYL